MSPDANDLNESLQGMPGLRKVIATNKAFRELMLEWDGTFLLYGKLWFIKSTPVGAGLRKVWLSETE